MEYFCYDILTLELQKTFGLWIWVREKYYQTGCMSFLLIPEIKFRYIDSNHIDHDRGNLFLSSPIFFRMNDSLLT